MQERTNADLLPLSALQHYSYCPRQFALIHVEQQWVENRYTAEGQVLHQRVNSGEVETRSNVHTARSLHIVSRELGLTGVADVVEFRRVDHGGCRLAGRTGQWQPYPVEYKRGRSKADDCDRIQLCAQAMALEEMLDVSVLEGAIFYGQPRRREQVAIDEPLRAQVRQIASDVHVVFTRGRLPAPEPGPKCEHCSLRGLCLPEIRHVGNYLARMFEE
ncbi:MAG: CRISPR-associated protein Cas4 [Anaerolineae bacterium]|nr:CRISPR-associated protein Cas4 [Anaerolineae bacterium]